jgi:hypothetical protein
MPITRKLQFLVCRRFDQSRRAINEKICPHFQLGARTIQRFLAAHRLGKVSRLGDGPRHSAIDIEFSWLQGQATNEMCLMSGTESASVSRPLENINNNGGFDLF